MALIEDGRTDYIFSLASLLSGVSKSEIMKFVTQEENTKAVVDFIKQDDHRLIFFFDRAPPPSTEITDIIITSDMNTVNISLKTFAVYFININKNSSITASNVQEVVASGVLSLREGGGSASLAKVMSNVLLPSMKLKPSLDSSSRQPVQPDKQEQIKSSTLVHLQIFSDTLEVAGEVSGGESVITKLKRINIPTGKSREAQYQKRTVLVEVEETLLSWIEGVKRVLTESQHLRQDFESMGPQSELNYWKTTWETFGFILDDIESDTFRNITAFLHETNSHYYKQCMEIEEKVRQIFCEVKECIKYLKVLNRVCIPLYTNNPVTVMPDIPLIMHSVCMLNGQPCFRRNNERISSIFTKITNQIILSCKNFISNNGENTIWDQPQDELIEKLGKCINLNDEYQKCFYKKKREMSSGQPFTFSEAFVFGKFNIFCSRLRKILRFFSIEIFYRDLFSRPITGILGCSDEDLTNLSSKFESASKYIRTKTYDLIDYRNLSFDEDLIYFVKETYEIQKDIVNMVDKHFEMIPTAYQAVNFLLVLERMKLEQLTVDDKIKKILVLYKEEINTVTKHFEKRKKSPPISNMTLPAMGKFMWSKTLEMRISQPVNILTQQKWNLAMYSSWNIVKKKSDSLKHRLIVYQSHVYKLWIKEVKLLKPTDLVRLQLSSEFTLIFNPKLLEVLKESDFFLKNGYEIPPFTQNLSSVKTKLYTNKAILQELLTMAKNNQDMLALELDGLLRPFIKKTNKSLKCGLKKLNYLSLNLPVFVENEKEALTVVKGIVERANTIMSLRLKTSFVSISELDYFQFDSETPETVDDFVEKLESRCKIISADLKMKSTIISNAIKDILGVIRDSKYFKAHPTGIDEEQMEEASCDFVSTFWQQYMNVILKSIYKALTSLRIMLKDGRQIDSKPPIKRPVLKLEAVISNSVITFSPNMTEIQQMIQTAGTLITDTTKQLPNWSREIIQDITSAASNPGTPRSQRGLLIHRKVTENKEVARLNLSLRTSITDMKTVLNKQVMKLNKYSHLWTESKKSAIDELLKGECAVPDFESRISWYNKIEKMIQDEPSEMRVGGFMIDIEAVKSQLMLEAKAWSEGIGQAVKSKFNENIHRVHHVLTDLTRKLARSVKDLEDVQLAVKALKDVRKWEVDFELSVLPIEECYVVLHQLNVSVNTDEIDQLDSLRYYWQKVCEMSAEKQTLLTSVQPIFQAELDKDLKELTEQCEKFYVDYDEKGPMVSGLAPVDASDKLSAFQHHFDALWLKYLNYCEGASLFGRPAPEFPRLHQLKKELNLLQKLYRLYNEVIERVNKYYDIVWEEIDIEKISNELVDFQNRCRKLPKGLKEWPAFFTMKKTIDDFTELCPLLELMTNKAMKLRHWNRLAEITGHNFELESSTFCLRNIMTASLLPHKEDIEDVCVSALKEKDIEAKLKQVASEWSSNELKFTSFKNRGELLLRGDHTGEIIFLLEDSLMVLGSLLSNRYNAPFRKLIQRWVLDLTNTNEILERWLFVQNLWVYLEAVFVGGDIAKQLPKEAKRFSSIDKSWVKIMSRAHDRPNVVECCVGDDTLKQLLPHLQEQLEVCQKSLTGYLEKKRLHFPRFFFVSDPALLEILGKASDSHSIQNHLLSIFDNTAFLCFDENDYDTITAITSSEGETLTLQKPVKCEGNVEIWLMSLLKMAQHSLHCIIKQAIGAMQEPTFNLLEFLNTYPAQVGLLGLEIIWTKDAENALFCSSTDKKIMTQTNEVFLEVLNSLIEHTAKELSPIDRTKFETLVTIHVHQRDIFDSLCAMKLKSPSDFEWLRQCRFYFKEDIDKTVISITDVNFHYQNEFLGCTERLVITPLTDRCYITLAQAISMSMGGCPTGPAGTGKTETTKDMGKALGKYVVVFNCSDQMDYRGLGRIFKGLAQSGSWGCFDEFNRIRLPVLSVAAQQIAIVLTCKKEKKPSFVFSDGDIVPLNPEFGIFLTMNPGYAGRQELPENLKVQFRTVAMMVPDRQIIIRVKLASCGFLENITLARKFYTLYKLCEEQLTKQVHYDFGLRNILSVLRTLGATKKQHPSDSESMIVMRVLRGMNLSKLVDEDEPLFLSLITDLFPGITMEKQSYPDLEKAIEETVEAEGLINHTSWTLKLIQLYEIQLVRHGIMTLGPSGSGKTTCIQMLMKALTKLGTNYKEMRMNPKAISSSQMFGRLDVATNDWTDGIFSTLWRKTLKAKKGDHIWLVLDGPVDAVWIENLNSVLDDNRTLTLANGDRIPMSPSCKVIFEVHSIDNASPATVSRNGMVYMSSSGLNWRPVLQAWLAKNCPTHSTTIMELFESSFESCFQWSKHNLVYKMNVLECNIIQQATNLLEGLLPPEDKRDDLNSKMLGKLYVFALMWSIGAFVEVSNRVLFEGYLRSSLGKVLDLPPQSEDSNMFDYLVDEKGSWQHWNTKVEDYIYPDITPADYSSILIPNIDNVRTEFLIKTVAKLGKPVLLLGESGTAKTVMIKAFVKKYNPETHLSKTFNFSSASTTMHFQRTVESFIDKRIGSTYGPPAGKKMSIFIDDINMPMINEWGDQVTNEIVRQTIEMKGFYNLEKPGEFIVLQDIQFLAAMCHPGGGRNDIPSRLKRHFTIFNCTLPSDSSIDKIFRVIGGGHYTSARGFCDEVIDTVLQLVSLTRKLWQWTITNMLPTPAKFHYIFNLRDLSRVWQGMVSAQSNVINTPETILSLWKHECTRVIADRFVDLSEQIKFETAMLDLVKENLGKSYVKYVKKTRYFVDFLRDVPEGTGDEEESEVEIPKIYEPVENLTILEQRLKSLQTLYNEVIRGTGLDLVFFEDAMIHLVKIARIIRMPGGNALLVGVGGSGKQSLTKLASFIAGYKTFQITLTRSYNTNNLLEDLKILYRTTGIQDKGTTFIFSDQDVKEEGFLEYLNNILSSGMVSNLFSRDEQTELIQELMPIMKREQPKTPPTPDNVMEFFLARSRKNLHIVLCFSPDGEKFRTRALKFPGFISACTIDWFLPWPKDALNAVARHFLSDFDQCSHDVKENLAISMSSVHQKVAECCKDYFERYRRTCHVTPKSYLSFISGYKNVYYHKRDEIAEMATRMDNGLAKLAEASVSVEKLKKELAIMEKELAIAVDTAAKVLNEVTLRAKAAETVKDSVEKAKIRAKAIVDDIAVDKSVAEEKLEAARPALEEAEAALNTIKPAHIATVRKLGRPPHLIMRIMDCVLILFQRRLQQVQRDPEKKCMKPSWDESLKLMSGAGFLQALQNYPKDTINDEIVELMEPYLSMEDYNMETAKRVCGDVAGLLSWTKSMVAFFGINKEVLPLKANLAIQEARLSVAMAELAKVEAELTEKEEELKEVKAQYDEAMHEKDKLENQTSICRRKMSRAATLITELGEENRRWTEQSKNLKEQNRRLVGDALLATGFLSYMGPFNQEYRNVLSQHWTGELSLREIPFSDNLNFTEMLSDPSTISEWNFQGLPSDELSIQNGIIITKTNCYPLLIDPQGQGKQWIKNRESKNELQITSLNHKYFRQHLEDSLSLGRPILIEDVGEELDPILDNILEKNFIKSGSLIKVMIGEKECDLLPGFKLYVTSKLSNPSYSPDVSAKVALIDFTVTVKGLEDQLLGRVIIKEKAELESERIALMQDVMENKRKIQEFEDSLLFRLTSTKGSLVDDEDLIIVLQDTKTVTQQVSKNLRVSAETQCKINEAREEFRAVATRGSLLYFLVVEMSMVNVMYQTSLRQFLQLFDLSLARSAGSSIVFQRVQNIISFLTYTVYKSQVRGVYENHKFLFTLLLALKIDLHSGKVNYQQFFTLIKGGASLELKKIPPKPFKWMLEVTWLNLVQLSYLPEFENILKQVTNNEKTWKTWVDSDRPEEEVMPENYGMTLNVFQKLLLIRSWCPDRTISQARKYVSESLDPIYSEEIILDLEETWSESDNRTPLVCFLSVGADPTVQIESLAKRLQLECRSISMGQGQEVPGRQLLNQSMENGSWVLLQNCHLSLKFCEELLDALLETETIHADFRVWITTEIHPQFPIGLLQTSIKFTNDPPQGIRASLKRTFASLTQDILDFSTGPQWQPVLFALAFLHTIVQERRKYGPLGWNIPYEFNQSDFSASMQFLQKHLDDVDPKIGICWRTVSYMLGEVMYGGRVTDDFDKRLLHTYTDEWITERLLSSDFEFATGYHRPPCHTITQYLDYINSLPQIDSPEVFGLHQNADITHQINTAQDILLNILSIQPKVNTDNIGDTREANVLRLATDMISKLPEDYVDHEVKARLIALGLLEPMNIFLRQEIGRVQKLLTVVRSTLLDLQLAIEGTIIMSESLQDALDSMYDGKIPTSWKKISWESATLSFWFSELQERDAQFRNWLAEGRPNAFWMAGFFNPQGFLTAMRQEVTRLHKGWALDTAVQHNEVTRMMKEDITGPPAEGVYVYGLYLDGAGWDRKLCQLRPSKPKVLFEPMPVIHIFAVNSTEGKNVNLYECPVYKKPGRTDEEYITSFDLSSSLQTSNWVLQGVALLCDIK